MASPRDWDEGVGPNIFILCCYQLKFIWDLAVLSGNTSVPASCEDPVPICNGSLAIGKASWVNEVQVKKKKSIKVKGQPAPTLKHLNGYFKVLDKYCKG